MYDGTKLHGWQIQSNERTVQGDIESAISLIFPNESVSLIGAGRTDAGVHAIGQVANVKLPDKLSAKQLIKAINGNLDRDIRIKSIEEISNKFHARFSAMSREYKYCLSKNNNPICRNFSSIIKYNIDIRLLNKCTKIILGKHDFTSFSKANAEVNHKICIIYMACWEETKDLFIFRIRSNRFLQHMVRFLVGTMLEVGRGKYSVADFDCLLINKSNKNAICAPPQGLFLKEVYYDN